MVRGANLVWIVTIVCSVLQDLWQWTEGAWQGLNAKLQEFQMQEDALTLVQQAHLIAKDDVSGDALQERSFSTHCVTAPVLQKPDSSLTTLASTHVQEEPEKLMGFAPT